MLWRAGLVHFGVVLAAAFGLGVLRALVLAPALGAVAAVAVEVPVVLGLSWLVAGRVLRRWPMGWRGRLALGGLAFALLMTAETGLALLSGQTLARLVTAMTMPEGLLGLAGQIAYAMLPVMHPAPGRRQGSG